jgi:hypothetical protein
MLSSDRAPSSTIQRCKNERIQGRDLDIPVCGCKTDRILAAIAARRSFDESLPVQYRGPRRGDDQRK